MENTILHAVVVGLASTVTFFLLSWSRPFRESDRSKQVLMAVPIFVLLALLMEIILPR